MASCIEGPTSVSLLSSEHRYVPLSQFVFLDGGAERVGRCVVRDPTETSQNSSKGPKLLPVSQADAAREVSTKAILSLWRERRERKRLPCMLHAS